MWGKRRQSIGPEDRTVGPQAAERTCGPCHTGVPADRSSSVGWSWEVRTVDEKSSWTRVAISIAIDWRFVTALVVLVLALLLAK